MAAGHVPRKTDGEPGPARDSQKRGIHRLCARRRTPSDRRTSYGHAAAELCCAFCQMLRSSVRLSPDAGGAHLVAAHVVAVRGMPRCRRGRQRSSAVKRRLQSPLACREGDLPLPKSGNGAIHRRESGKCRFNGELSDGGGSWAITLGMSQAYWFCVRFVQKQCCRYAPLRWAAIWRSSVTAPCCIFTLS